MSDKDKIKICFWIYLFFVIFEGGLRKWILPGVSDIFLVIRDPIIIYVLYLGLKNKLLKDFFAKFLIVISLISFFTTLFWGHHNVSVAIYGLRIVGLHLPAMFVFGNVLTRGDLLKIGSRILLTLVPMTVILILQYFLPQTSWINVGIGGVESSGFSSGFSNYFRPSGTFSFISGMEGYELLIGCFLFYFIIENKKIPIEYRLSKFKLVLYSITFVFSVFLCLSRTVIFEVIIIMFFVCLSAFIVKTYSRKAVIIVGLSLIIFVLLYNISYFKIAVDNMMTRFESASYSEGHVLSGTIGERYLGSFYRAFTDTQNFTEKEIPFWGFGLGIGTKVGEKMLGISRFDNSFAVAEEEWSRIVCEMGLLLGGLFLLVFRLYWGSKISIKSVLKFRKNKDLLPFILIPAFFIFILNKQLAPPTLLGFCVVFSSLQLAALKTSKKNMYED